MKKLIPMILLAVMLFACGKKEQSQSSADTAKVSSDTIATSGLTAQQQAEGWKLLFDGKSTNGFRFFKDRKNNSWEVIDGTLHVKPVKGEGDERSDLMTVAEYGNFELTFEWKVAAGANSGVIYRATEEFDAPYMSGPEYQVIDDKGYHEPLKEAETSGSNFAMQSAMGGTLNPPGEWNAGKVVANGNHVEHWLNGVKVVEYEIGSADWKKRKDGSKWKTAVGYGASAKGHLDFQDHGGEVWYRNIKVREL